MPQIWGFEDHFLAQAYPTAQSLFQRIDQRLEPRVFLAAIRLTGSDGVGGRVYPAAAGYTNDVLNEVSAQAGPLREMHANYSLLYCDRTADDYHQREQRLSALTNKIRATIEAQPSSGPWLTFCSRLVPIDDFVVTVVLQLSKSCYDESIPHLKHGIVDGMFGVLPSLSHSAAEEFVAASQMQLNLRNAGGSYIPWPDSGEILRTAATKFMVTPAAAGHEAFNLYGLYDACNSISALPYEGQEGHGRIVVSRRPHPSVTVAVQLATQVDIQNHRAVRKLLEISSDVLCLLSDAGVVYGLGSVAADYNPELEDVFEIQFVKQFTWELTHAGRALMRVANGEPQLPRSRFNEVHFRATVNHVFPGLPPAHVDRLVHSAEIASQERHGTMLVISSDAAGEAVRLARQATPIQPKQLNDAELERITRIDGAVLMTPDATCHAIGVILDGTATPQGNPARGARYNSAIRYIATRQDEQQQAIAVVISEDGMIDFFPQPPGA